LLTRREAVTLGKLDFLRVESALDSSLRIERGPQLFFGKAHDSWPASGKEVATVLSVTTYLEVEDKLTGERRLEKGPGIFFPSPYDHVRTTSSAIALKRDEFIRLKDTRTGKVSQVNGEALVFVEPFVSVVDGGVQKAWALRRREYIRLEDKATGTVRFCKGEQLVFPTATEELLAGQKKGVQQGVQLKVNEYVKLRDTATGRMRCEAGERIVFPGATEEFCGAGTPFKSVCVDANNACLVLDEATGQQRLVTKPGLFSPSAEETVVEVRPLIKLADHEAVIVRDAKGKFTYAFGSEEARRTAARGMAAAAAAVAAAASTALTVDAARGTGASSSSLALSLGAQKPSLLSPLSAPPVRHQDVEVDGDKERKGIEEEEEEEGDYDSASSADALVKIGNARAFFLPPHCDLVELLWSRGRRREKRDLRITKFDIRPQYMSFEFDTRTADNVELTLEGTFFWEVADFPAMVNMTGDAPGDICNHARSQFIQLISKVKLSEFMEDFNEIARRVHSAEDSEGGFYAARGIKIHSLEVTRYQCANASTAGILEQIIAETTNRMNRLSKQESENEIRLFAMQGEIEQEKLNGDLLAIKHEHACEEARIEGRAEAARVTTFLEGLSEAHAVTTEESRVEIWRALRKNEAIADLSKGSAAVYFTPSDVNLSIESAPRQGGGGN